MKKNIFWLAIIVLGSSFLPGQGRFDYQLPDSPAITWNGFPFYDSRMTALAGISLGASSSFNGASHPALAQQNPGLELGISLTGINQQAFQYWGVNEGVVFFPAPLSRKNFSFSGFSFSLNRGKWQVSWGCLRTNVLALPSFLYQETYSLGQYYQYQGDFSGLETSCFVTLAVSLSNHFSFGLKMEYVSGRRKNDVIEEMAYNSSNQTYPVMTLSTLRQNEYHRSYRFIPNLGFTWKPFTGSMIALAMGFPINGKVERSLTRSLTYVNPNLTIEIPLSTSDPSQAPVYVTAGGWIEIPRVNNNKHTSKVKILAEVKTIFWSGYRHIFFGEDIAKPMSNTTSIALAGEWQFPIRHHPFFCRLGFRLDPQPLKDPQTTLKIITTGFGFQSQRFSFDIGFAHIYAPLRLGNLRHMILVGNISYSLSRQRSSE